MPYKPPVRRADQTDAQYACDVAWREAAYKRHQLYIAAFDVWRDCAQPGCRRRQACAGDPHRCFMAFRRRMTDEEWAPLREAFYDFIRQQLGAATIEEARQEPDEPSAPPPKPRRRGGAVERPVNSR